MGRREEDSSGWAIEDSFGGDEESVMEVVDMCCVSNLRIYVVRDVGASDVKERLFRLFCLAEARIQLSTVGH